MGSVNPREPIPMVIAIDGPAGAGKSTIAKAVAKRLSVMYLDTGAMYRALTLKALRANIPLDDSQALVDLAHRTHIDIQIRQNGALVVLLDAEDVSEAIRSPEVTNATFYIARVGGVREVMVKRQREIASCADVVVEGRDVGTVVFPQATYKFYLDADLNERANRRLKELKDKGKDVQAQQLIKDIWERDTKDQTRTIGPLKKADDAIVIDSTHLSIDEVAACLLTHIKKSDG